MEKCPQNSPYLLFLATVKLGVFRGALTGLVVAERHVWGVFRNGPVVVELHAGVGDEVDQVVPVFVDAFDQGFSFAFGDGGAGKSVEP